MEKWLILLVGIICISISAIFVKLAEVNGLASALYRIIFALVVVGPIYLLAKKGQEKIRNNIICIVGGICFGLELAFWNVSVMISNATIPTLLVNLSSIWVGLGAMAFLKEKPNIAHWIGAGISLIGLIVVIGINQIIMMKIENGVLFALIGSIFLAAYSLVVKHARLQMKTIDVLFYSLIGSSIPLIIICLIYNAPLYGFSGQSWFYLICIGIVVQVGGYFSINYALGHMPAIKVSLITLLQPVITGIFASLIIGEIVQRKNIVGGLIVLLGLSISFLNIKKRKIVAI